MLTQVIRLGLGRKIKTRKKNDGSTIFLVTALCGTRMLAVYAPHRHRIVTFLPFDCWEMKYWEAIQQKKAAYEALRGEALVD